MAPALLGGPQSWVLVFILPETCSCVLSAFPGIAEHKASASYRHRHKDGFTKIREAIKILIFKKAILGQIEVFPRNGYSSFSQVTCGICKQDHLDCYPGLGLDRVHFLLRTCCSAVILIQDETNVNSTLRFWLLPSSAYPKSKTFLMLCQGETAKESGREHGQHR